MVCLSGIWLLHDMVAKMMKVLSSIIKLALPALTKQKYVLHRWSVVNVVDLGVSRLDFLLSMLSTKYPSEGPLGPVEVYFILVHAATGKCRPIHV